MTNPDFIDALFERECWVIDPLPWQAPAEVGQYFAMDRYWREDARLRSLYARFADLVMKLNCYYDVRVCPGPSEEWTDNPAPERLAQWFSACVPGGGCRYLLILIGEGALLHLDGGDLYLSVYNPDVTLQTLVDLLARAQGLFLRRSKTIQP